MADERAADLQAKVTKSCYYGGMSGCDWRQGGAHWYSGDGLHDACAVLRVKVVHLSAESSAGSSAGGGYPKGGVIWRTPQGSITLVECKKDIARWLYLAPERPTYLISSYTGQGSSGVVGGLTLVASIVLFGNATWTSKAALLATCTTLNIVYWLVTLCPPRGAWRFNVEVEETLYENPTFTTAPWTATRLSKKSRWVLDSVSAPKGSVWEEWLRIVEKKVNAEDHHWDAHQALIELLQ